MNEQVKASAKSQSKHQTPHVLTSDVKTKHTVQWNSMFEMWICYLEHQFFHHSFEAKETRNPWANITLQQYASMFKSKSLPQTHETEGPVICLLISNPAGKETF